MDANVTYAGPGGSRRAARPLLRRRRPAHRAPALRRPQRAAHQEQRRSTRARCRARGRTPVWIGNVLIRKVAEGIETYEENRNLVLTDGCQADSVPNLEIETGEIAGAGHARPPARFDDEQLFYLRSRGISEKEARRLVVHGFFNDLIRKIGVAVDRGAADGHGRGRAGQERAAQDAEAICMAFERACALAEVPTDEALAVTDRRATTSPWPATATRSSPSAGPVLATPRSRSPRARSTTAPIECWLHGSMLRPAHRQAHRPPGDRAGRHLPRRDPRRDDVVSSTSRPP